MSQAKNHENKGRHNYNLAENFGGSLRSASYDLFTFRRLFAVWVMSRSSLSQKHPDIFSLYLCLW